MSYLHFPVSHSMAPLSHLLVYYVRDNGEGVTDSVQIPVQPDFENQVCFIPKRVLFFMFCSVGVKAFFPEVNALVPVVVALSDLCPKLLLWCSLCQPTTPCKARITIVVLG